MDEIRLKKITDSIGLMQKNLECSICLDLLQDPVSTKCDHQFCNFCVLALLQSSRKPSARCPLCKIVITKRSLTKNEQLDEIVKAVRSVITAVEEDSGLRCSPPRGPVLFSQPDPKPRQPSPQKKVKGQTSAKVKGQGRAANVRKTKRKAAETVSVYRDDSDSSDSDAFELPLVGHTNISSSFPRLKISGKKGYHDDDQENDELEREAEDLLAALNAAPLTSHGNIISGYSNDTVQRNNEINLHPINSENPGLDSQTRTGQESTLPDSEIFEIPAPKISGKVNILKEGDQDPYEFVPSQRTPRKIKKKAGRRKNQNGKKEFPIMKGRFTKPSISKRNHMSASSCSESDHDGALNQSKTGDQSVKGVALGAPSKHRNAYANSRTQNTIPTSGHIKDGGKGSHTHPKDGGKELHHHLPREDGAVTAIIEEDARLDSAEVVIEDTCGYVDNNPDDQYEAPIANGKLIKHPLPITPVVVIKRKGVPGGNLQGSQQSSEGGMMTDSQPVVMNRNHGRRVFATTYGKAKNGVDKSPPLDPQERIRDWLVSKNAESDDSGDDDEEKEEEKKEEEEKEKEVAGNSEELPDILNLRENDVENRISLPTEKYKDAPNAVPNISTIEDESEPAEESKARVDKNNKTLPTPKKREHNEALEKIGGKRRSGRHSKETEKVIPDAAAGEGDTCDITEFSISRLKKQEGKEPQSKTRTAKQRMEENYKQKTEAARKESEVAAIKSDWELALELARQFGTEPEHLKAEPVEAGGRSSRRRKGKLTIEAVPESKPVKKSRRHVQEHQEKENEECNETIDIDSFETQNLNKVSAKRTVKERSSSGADKKKSLNSDQRKPPGNQANDQNCDVQQTNTPEAPILKIPETPFILNQPTGKTSLEGGFPPEKGFVEAESQEQSLESRQRKTVPDTEDSSRQSEEHYTPESKSSQPLTPSLRRSKRGSQPGLPNSNSEGSAQVMSCSMEKKKKAKVTAKVQEDGTDSRKTRGIMREPSDEDDLENQPNFSLPVMTGIVKEAEEKVGNEETALASLPLYTEDIPKDDKDKKCRGSDTTESIDLEIDSDEYEEADDAMEKELELPSGGSPAKKSICSSSPEKQQKPSLDEEMSIMDCILPSITSQECPALGISPDLSGNCSGIASEQMERDDQVDSMSQKPDEVLKMLSGSSGTGQQASQASVTIISQTKTSGSFPVSLDLNSHPSESLLQPPKKSKRKNLQDRQQESTLHTRDADNVKKLATSPGAEQKVESTSGTCDSKDVPEVQTSSGSGNSRPTRRISRRKRKTFTIDACAPVSASPVPDSVEHPATSLDNQMESKLTTEANQSQQSPSVPSHIETHEADNPVNLTGDSKAPADVDVVENLEAPSCLNTHKNLTEVRDKISPQKASLGKRRSSRSLPIDDSKRSGKRGAKIIDNSADESPASVNASQETLVSDMSGSSLKLKRKSRNSGRQSTQSPTLHRNIEESVVQPSASDQISHRLPDVELDGKCSGSSRVADGRRSSGRRSKIPTKPEVTTSSCSGIPTTPGASELNEQSSNVIIPARPFQLHLKRNLIEGAVVPDKSPLTPRSSPRVLRRSSRQSRDMAQHKNETATSNVADEEVALEPRIGTPPQECIIVVDESIGMSLAEKEESQESHKSSYSVEDIFNIHEESRDMFDEEEQQQQEEEDKVGKQDRMAIAESQNLNAEIMLLSEDLPAKDGCSPSGIDDTESRAGYKSHAKQEIQRKSPRSAEKSQHLDAPDEIGGTTDAAISQGSCKYDDTDALIPPTPPVHDPSKFRPSSFLHTSGLSKAIAKRKKAHVHVVEVEPDMSSLLCPDEEIITEEQDSIQAKSLVMETPTVTSRRRNRASHSQTRDKSVADTPVKPKHGSGGRKGRASAIHQNAVTNQTEDEEGALEQSKLSPKEPSSSNLRHEEPPSKTCRRLTSQTIGDTPLEVELPIKSSNESDEVMRTNVRRRKHVITDDVSDDEDDDGGREFIGRQKRKKAQRMVQVARDEEDESDDELIPCSFLQTSVKKLIEMEEEEDHEDIPIVTFSDQANPHLSHEADGGSASSEDSCASHHMNLTSASSILSSQSEIMNTQQQEKTREHMQALEEQMAELQAALSSERGSRSHDDTNDEEEEDEEENPRGLLVEETEEPHTPASNQNSSTRSRHRSPERTKRRSKAVQISDEDDDDDEMDEDVVVEPRSPSPPPPLSPSTVRKASSSSSMSDSIRSVTSMVEQFRKSSSKKATTKKRRIEEHQKDASDDDDGSDDDAVVTVSSKSPRNLKSPLAGSSRRSSKKRRIERESLDSDEDKIQDRLRSPPKSRPDSRQDSIGRKVERHETVHHGQTPASRTTPTHRTSGSRKSPSNNSHRDGLHTPRSHTLQNRIRTPQDHLTPTRTPDASSSVPSPADISMKTQRTSSEVYSPAQSKRRSGDRSLRTPEGGPGPSSRPKSRPMSLIATGLNRLELRQVEQLTSRLANCRFASAFNANTTHVIVKTDSSLVCERTLKYFQGIAAKAWIVSFQWIHDSLKARKLLGEEDYEVKGDVVNGLNHHGPKRARTCEGPGFMAKFDLCCIGPFTGLNKDQLVGLCEMCGASTVQHPSLFPYGPGRKAFIVVEPNLDTERDYQGLQRKFRVPVISREWILDSIAHYKSQPITEYLLSDHSSLTVDQPFIDLDSDDDDQ